jgi:hypothetical protein
MMTPERYGLKNLKGIEIIEGLGKVIKGLGEGK